MLVDNPIFQPSYFTAGASTSHSDFQELNDIFDTELFNNTFAFSNSVNSSPPSGSGSRGSTPQGVLTPPQDILPTSFPEVHDGDNNNNIFSLYDDDMKVSESSLSGMPSMAASDFLNFTGFDGVTYGGANPGMPFDMSAFSMGMGMDMAALTGAGVGLARMEDLAQARGIDPQLVDTPSAISDHGDDEDSDEKESPKPDNVTMMSSPESSESPVAEKEVEKPTITIAPVKVGGHGKARKGTVQSGGVVKKMATTPANKENATNVLSAATKKAVAAKASAASASTSATTLVSGLFSASGNSFTSGDSNKAESEAGDDDDLPKDWRPSPEVFAKMTSKEKRQLRNKISARNFRVRRKEYISTLEGDIAERDRMLDHYRTQLSSTESENLALRQEIAALKKALLDGRNGTINLPPPAPLPEQSAAEALAAAAASSTTTSTPLLTPNTQKDLPSSSSPRMSNRFWGGLGMSGGFTPVHTTLVPDVSSVVRRGLQENMNPALNGPALNGVGSTGLGMNKGLSGFDGFSDLNPFTMKTLDAYRMHLWGKMAAQQQHHQRHSDRESSPTPSSPGSTYSSSSSSNHSHNGNSNLSSSMRPHFFTPSSKHNLPPPPTITSGSTLSALLSGKHGVVSAYPSPPSSPRLISKSFPSSTAQTSSQQQQQQQQREKEQQQAMLAAMASQTVFRKLGSAFWDAFTGSGGSGSNASSSSVPSSSSSNGSGSGNWDQDKVQRVLSGKAVLKVVDIEPVASTSASVVPVAAASPSPSCCSTALTDILEESMRSLTLGKKM